MMEALANQFQGLMLDEIQINYAEYRYANIQQVDMLTDILTREEERSDVVVFGEGNFTFSIALASRRGSWDGITSTRYEPISDEHPMPAFSDVKEETLRYCISNGRLFGDASDVILPKVEQVLDLSSPPDDTWRFDVDATRIPEGLQVGGKVAWFQCPWISNNLETGRLVADFLEHMRDRQGPGDYSLVGIVTKFPYVKNYRLGELLGDGLANRHTHNYEFLGADQNFVRELLQYGYHHQGCVERHDRFVHWHITLVFRRLNDVPQQ